MSEAREIIARAIEPFVHHADDVTSVVANTLTTAGYRILGPDEVSALQRALAKAEDGAGTLPARDAVKLRPADWHAIGDLIRALGRKA